MICELRVSSAYAFRGLGLAATASMPAVSQDVVREIDEIARDLWRTPILLSMHGGDGVMTLRAAAMSLGDGDVRRLLEAGVPPRGAVHTHIMFAPIDMRRNGSPLACASMAGNVLAAKRLLNAGAPLDDPNDMYPPLAVAASGGHADIVRMLLDHGANANATDVLRKTALHNACMRDDRAAIVRMLLDAGADVGILDMHSRTPMHCAVACCRANDAEVVRMLIRAGAGVNAAPGYRAPLAELLHHARDRAPPDMSACLRALLEAGADPNVHDHGASALELCVYSPFGESYARLLIHAGAAVDAPSGARALSSALHHRNARLVKILLDAGADPRAAHALHASRTPHDVDTFVNLGLDVNERLDERTPLQVAAGLDSADVVEALLAHGADPTLATPNAEPALIVAIASNRLDALDVLLKHGADPSIEWRDETPMISAVREFRVDALKRLVDAGTDVRAHHTLTGQTALHHAVEVLSVESVVALLDAGADVNARDHRGRTPIMMFEAVLSTWRDPRKDECLATLLQRGASLDAVDDRGRTPLMVLCAKLGMEHNAIKLVDAGVDVRRADATGFGALHYASLYTHDTAFAGIDELLDRPVPPPQPPQRAQAGGDPEYNIKRDRCTLIEALVAAGADVNARAGRIGRTPLMVAAAQGAYGTVETLVRLGADRTLVDNANDTALDYAHTWHHHYTVLSDPEYDAYD